MQHGLVALALVLPGRDVEELVVIALRFTVRRLMFDAEMTARMMAAAESAANPWQGLVDECNSYIQMALEPEIQRIVFRDGPAVLGDPSLWPNAGGCVAMMTDSVARLQQKDIIADVDAEAAARVINGALGYASQWIANADDPGTVSEKAVQAFNVFLEGLLRRKPA